jgi:phytoene/squalene synthetase
MIFKRRLPSLNVTRKKSNISARFSSSESSYLSLRKSILHTDFEGYLCASFAPSSSRESLLVTRAFNAELAAIRESIRGNSASGHLRLGFWRSVIDNAFSSNQRQYEQITNSPLAESAVGRHPLFVPLRDSIKRHRHTRRWFERLIDARASDLDQSRDAEQISIIPNESKRSKSISMSLNNTGLSSFTDTSCEATSDTLAEAEVFAEQTNSTMLYLALEAVGVRDVHADHAASHVGKAVGLCAMLRSLPVHCRQGQVFLPAALLAKHGIRPIDLVISPEEVFTSNGKSLLEEAEENATKSSEGDNGKRGLAMTLARSSSFGGGADIQSISSSNNNNDNVAETKSAPILPKRPIDEGAGGVRLALSPAAARLALATNTAKPLPSVKQSPLPPAKQQRSPAWSAATAMLRSGAGASQLVLAKSPEIMSLIREVVFDVACQAKAHIDHARGMQKLVPSAARAALLPAVCVDRFLRRLEAQNFDIFSGGGVGPWSDGRPYARLLLQSELLRFTVTNSY